MKVQYISYYADYNVLHERFKISQFKNSENIQIRIYHFYLGGGREVGAQHKD